MRNHEVLQPQKLLDSNGNIAEPGWARRPLWQYDPKDVKAPAWRIKEWDYYLVVTKDFAVAFTISNNRYFALQSVTYIDFKAVIPREKTDTMVAPFPGNAIILPKSSTEGDVTYVDKWMQLRFEKLDGKRHIICIDDPYDNYKGLTVDIMLEEPEMDSLSIATPFNKSKHFYYNQKINCMRASGYVKYDGEEYKLNPETDFGTLDWGRGVWTYDNTWYWGSGNCDLNGHAFGFNIGYGFGDTTAATENVLFYDGKAHKLDDITFNIPDIIMDPWTITSSDGRFEMDFVPIIDRSAFMDYKLVSSNQHQVFGRMSGTAILDDGTKLEIKDLICFCEKVRNKY